MIDLKILKVWLLNIVMVIVFVSFIEILMPNNKMKKYLSLILGFVVMLVILNPLVNMINSKEDLANEFFKISNQLNKEEYTFVSKNIETKQQKQLLSLYKKRLKSDIVNRIENKYEVKVLDVAIDLEDNKEKMGEIKGMKVSIMEKAGSAYEKEVVPIVKIDVLEDSQEKAKDKDEQVPSKIVQERIQKDIATIYNIKDSDVIID